MGLARRVLGKLRGSVLKCLRLSESDESCLQVARQLRLPASPHMEEISNARTHASMTTTTCPSSRTELYEPLVAVHKHSLTKPSDSTCHARCCSFCIPQKFTKDAGPIHSFAYAAFVADWTLEHATISHVNPLPLIRALPNIKTSGPRNCAVSGSHLKVYSKHY